MSVRWQDISEEKGMPGEEGSSAGVGGNEAAHDLCESKVTLPQETQTKNGGAQVRQRGLNPSCSGQSRRKDTALFGGLLGEMREKNTSKDHNLYMNHGHSSFICYSPNLETTQRPSRVSG